jgi:DNA-binding Lrp family transcriptional regulator
LPRPVQWANACRATGAYGQSFGVPLLATTLSKHSREAYSNFDRRIRAIPEAVECYEITGHIDFHLKFVVSNERAVRIKDILRES